MSKTIEIRNVPDALHRKLKTRAAVAGQSLSDYLLLQVGDIAARPTTEEILERLRRLPPITPSIDPFDIIREHRDRK